MSAIVEQIPNPSVEAFVARCHSLGGIDATTIGDVARTTIAHLKGGRVERALSEQKQRLERRWYSALDSGERDWAVYASDLYLGDCFACWKLYSRRYLVAAAKQCFAGGATIVDRVGDPRVVVDLGCGVGLTTATLAVLFPRARIVGTNLPETAQWRIAAEYSREFGFTLKESFEVADAPADLVFASEYFEHFERPVEHLEAVLSTLCPSRLLIANTFTARSVGHFDRYIVGGRSLDGASASRAFNAALRACGYEKVRTTFWNNRPAYWERRGQAHESTLW